ncbi:MAG: hypothetical protein JST31_08980 [Actinobacteria bacterium]|nr:hypothetical protein [Actinomycetota bacterium]
MPPIYELDVPEFAQVKLGRRNISAEEALQLRWNDPEESANPHSRRGRNRKLLVGETNGGRRLTLVIERTTDPTAWLVITGWDT